MRQRPDSRVILRRAFMGLGLLLLFGSQFVVHSLLRVDQWSERVFAGDEDAQSKAIAIVTLAIVVTSLFAFVTAWGLKRNKPWARWSGVYCCIHLLAGFPWFTVPGLIGLYVLITRPPASESQTASPAPAAMPTKDYWASRRASKAQGWIGGIGLVLTLNATILTGMFARHAGMPDWDPGAIWWVYLFGFLLVNTLVHELGHASMAWILADRIRTIAVGPFTFAHDRDGYSFHFQWKRLLNSNGHVAAVPASGENLRRNFMASVAAGPAASLTSGIVFSAIFLCLPGTRWQGYWGPVALNALLGFYYAVVSSIPVGYSDGSMLYHLIRWTGPGEQLLNQLRVVRIQEDADEYHNQADFENEVELRRAGLELALAGGDANSMVIAICHQYLGHARLSQEDWESAAASFSKCLEFTAELALNPPLAANAWSGLEKACVERHQVNAVDHVYKAAVAAIEARKKDRDKLGLALTKAMMAQVHQRVGSYQKGRQEAEEGLHILPTGRERQYLRATLCVSEALCELGLGSIEMGLAAARRAAEILSSGQVASSRQNLAWDELGELGEELWRKGQPVMAVYLMREAIQHLESAQAVTTAAGYRIKLAGVLRQLGRSQEAWELLPAEGGLPIGLQRCLIAERVRLLLATDGHARDAVIEGRDLVALWQEPAGVELALAEALLACAYQEAGDSQQAELLARKAAAVLEPWKHSAVVNCRVTIALAEGNGAAIVLDDAFIAADPLLTGAEKTRLRESERARLDRHTLHTTA